MIPPEKPDSIILLTNDADIEYKDYSVRMINCKDLEVDATDPKNSIQQIDTAYTQQQVAAPLAPSGARVYLVPPENNVFTVNVRITSLRAEYEDTQSECDAFDSLARQSCAPKLILINEITFQKQ
ncbi:MAG: hypothetical protein EZS28_043120, partial [Streblomastix strix]